MILIMHMAGLWARLLYVESNRYISRSGSVLLCTWSRPFTFGAATSFCFVPDEAWAKMGLPTIEIDNRKKKGKN